MTKKGEYNMAPEKTCKQVELSAAVERNDIQAVNDLVQQGAELAYMAGSRAAQTTLAENYLGLPLA